MNPPQQSSSLARLQRDLEVVDEIFAKHGSITTLYLRDDGLVLMETTGKPVDSKYRQIRTLLPHTQDFKRLIENPFWNEQGTLKRIFGKKVDQEDMQCLMVTGLYGVRTVLHRRPEDTWLGVLNGEEVFCVDWDLDV
eukprot:TRINITY_DN3499_c0_g1_i2.p1 TRINITY_DN3499_c0_g1~~TRINITY_DN3499_c0_g1_i2.p1  ORF type:complete len:152 (+),score=17.64 TRINITY_DN3499_c0_g1_i2:46-456(+)